MGIWGKIFGGAAGFALGGPLGAVLGALAGHAVDRISSAEAPRDTEVRQAAFTMAVIVLSAKMAKADGVVTRDEIDAFKSMLGVSDEDMTEIGAIFDQARRTAGGFEPYARQVAEIFGDNPAVLEELLEALFHIARADGTYHPKEKKYLQRVAAIFGFDETDFARIEAEQIGPDEGDPYLILGVGRAASDDEIKGAYRKLIRENHPDGLVAQGLPQEFIDLANEKMATINAAYDRIEKERGLK